MALKKKKKEEEEEATATSPHTRYTQYFEGVVPTSFSACRCGRVVRRLTCPTQVDSETNNVGTHNETHRLRSQLMYFLYIYMYFVSCPEVFLEILKMATCRHRINTWELSTCYFIIGCFRHILRALENHTQLK